MSPKLKQRLIDIAIVLSIVLVVALLVHRCSVVVNYYNDPTLHQHVSPTNEMQGTP